MPKTGFHAEGAPAPAGPYSHGVVANGFLYTAGFGPQDAANGNAIADNVGDQTRQQRQQEADGRGFSQFGSLMVSIANVCVPASRSSRHTTNVSPARK